MAVAYKSQGAGVSTETSGAALSPLCPATVDANDILIAHVFWEGTATAPSTPSDWTLLSGPHVIESTIARHWVFGKIAAGTEDAAAVAFGSPAVTTGRGARVYSFSGWTSGSIIENVIGFAATSHATDPQMPTVTTTENGALAVALIGQNDNANAEASATGESGGDWVEAVAEYASTINAPGLTLGIQTCTPTANPGTVSGGSIATNNDPVGVVGFEIRPSRTTISATQNCTSTISGVGKGKGALLGVIAGLCTVAGDLTSTAGAIEGATSGSSTVSAVISAKGSLVTSIPNNSTVVAIISAKGKLEAVVSATSAASGVLSFSIYGQSDGTSTATAILTAKGLLSGTIAGTSACSLYPGEFGSAEGTSVCSGALTGKGKLTGNIGGGATIKYWNGSMWVDTTIRVNTF
jgi:hypothetical protein